MTKIKNIFLILLALVLAMSIISAVIKVSFYLASAIMIVLLAAIIYAIIRVMR